VPSACPLLLGPHRFSGRAETPSFLFCVNAYIAFFFFPLRSVPIALLLSSYVHAPRMSFLLLDSSLVYRGENLHAFARSPFFRSFFFSPPPPPQMTATWLVVVKISDTDLPPLPDNNYQRFVCDSLFHPTSALLSCKDHLPFLLHLPVV